MSVAFEALFGYLPGAASLSSVLDAWGSGDLYHPALDTALALLALLGPLPSQ